MQVEECVESRAKLFGYRFEYYTDTLLCTTTLSCLINVYPLLNVYSGILIIESVRVGLEMLPNKRVQWNFHIFPLISAFQPL